MSPFSTLEPLLTRAISGGRTCCRCSRLGNRARASLGFSEGGRQFASAVRAGSGVQIDHSLHGLNGSSARLLRSRRLSNVGARYYAEGKTSMQTVPAGSSAQESQWTVGRHCTPNADGSSVHLGSLGGARDDDRPLDCLSGWWRLYIDHTRM